MRNHVVITVKMRLQRKCRLKLHVLDPNMTHLLGTRSRSTSWRASPRALSKRPAPLATWTQNHNKHLRYQPHTRCLPPSIPELSKTFAPQPCCSAVSSELATVSSPLSVAAHPYHVASHLELPHLLQRIATRTRLLNFHIATAQHHTIVHVSSKRNRHRGRIFSTRKGCRAGTVQLQASQAIHHPPASGRPPHPSPITKHYTACFSVCLSSLSKASLA